MAGGGWKRGGRAEGGDGVAGMRGLDAEGGAGGTQTRGIRLRVSYTSAGARGKDSARQRLGRTAPHVSARGHAELRLGRWRCKERPWKEPRAPGGGSCCVRERVLGDTLSTHRVAAGKASVGGCVRRQLRVTARRPRAGPAQGRAGCTAVSRAWRRRVGGRVGRGLLRRGPRGVWKDGESDPWSDPVHGLTQSMV